MSEQESTRRKFLQIFGLTAGATLLNKTSLASFTDQEEIKKLNPEQQEFMIRYGKWMDEFTEVARIQKTDPDNQENQMQMIVLSKKAEELQPELNEHLKDNTFFLIYKASIKRLSNEI
jgi:hypothetical protein